MHWIRSHPFIASILGVIVILFLGGVLVWNKTATSASGSEGYTWGKYGGGRLSDITANKGSLGNPDPLEKEFTDEDFYTLLSDTRDKPYASLIPQTNVYESRNLGTTTNSEIIFTGDELAKLLASISPTAQIVAPYNPFDVEFAFSDIYAYVPATVAQESQETRKLNERQRELLNYGNEAGSYIESFVERWGDQSQILKQFMEDLNNEEKAQAVNDLAFALGKVGRDIEDMDVVPDDARGVHARLVSGYKLIGKKLEPVSNARSDEELLKAVIDYNSAADQFAKDYLSVVTLLSVAEVPFSSGEPGSVFVFKPSLSL
jgi:hypothetical protein